MAKLASMASMAMQVLQETFVGSACSSSAIALPKLFGGEILSISANPVTNYSYGLGSMDGHLPLDISGLDFCNVSVLYTHPGQQDYINVRVWLPLKRNWNGRFMGTGGGGFSTEMGEVSLSYAASLGYAAVSTDGGHPSLNYADPSSWALLSPGNINWPLLFDFASVALDDAATIGKQVSESFYGSAPKYSYWNGCSTGGRQGLMMAQRYPTQYNGIIAAAPAINFGKFVVAEYWGQQVMNRLGVYPPKCVFEAITAAAIEACDSLDGVEDGIVAALGLCHFDLFSLVGQSFHCADTDTEMTISADAATIASETWKGVHTPDGRFQWYGNPHDSPLIAHCATVCDSSGQKCKGNPFPISSSWISLFVERNPDFDVTQMSYDDYSRILRKSHQQFASILSTDDPDLTDFRDAGGKMITWHGLSDPLIFPNGSYDYYDRVRALDPHVADYYRFFPAPGVGHCAGGIGHYPAHVLQELVDWVEKGKAPDTLQGVTMPHPKTGVVRHAPLCPHPLVAAYKGGDANLASSFECAESF